MSEGHFSLWEGRPNIACPACGFSPPAGTMWICGPDGCGHAFDTFATHAHCPQCEAQFTWTWCPRCGGGSPHEAWYGGESSARELL